MAAPTFTAEAGLGGHARAGRWMPVTVILDAAASTSGQLTAEWGGAVARRALDIPAGARRAVTLLLRTGDPRARVDVTFTDGDGRTTLSAPVTVDADDTALVACVDGGTGTPCTVSIAAGSAPRDWRVWDAADQIHTPSSAALDDAQRQAIARWAGRHQGDAHFGSPVDVDALAAQVPARRVAPWLLLAVALPLAGPSVMRRRPRWRAPVQLAAIGVAALGALGAGRIGPAATLRHATVVHAFAGTDATIAEARLALDVTRDGRLRATLQSPGGWLEAPGPGRTPQILDGDGHPFVDLDARLGASYRLDAEYPGPPSPVRVTSGADRVVIENTSAGPLSACTFPDSLDARGVTTVDAASTATFSGAPLPGDVIRCQWDTAGPPLDGAGGRAEGASTLLLHLDTVVP